MPCGKSGDPGTKVLSVTGRTTWRLSGGLTRVGSAASDILQPMRTISRTVESALRVPGPLRWLAVAAWAGMIFLLSNQPGLSATSDPGVERPIRVVAHIVTYATLTLLLGWAASGDRVPTRAIVVGAAVIAFVYGITDEWHQSFVPSRSGSPVDLIWDLMGVLVGASVLLLARRAVRGPDT